MTEKVMALGETTVLVVLDDDDEALRRGNISPSMLKQLTQTSVLMSNDSLRMYVRATQWEAMKASFELTAR